DQVDRRASDRRLHPQGSRRPHRGLPRSPRLLRHPQNLALPAARGSPLSWPPALLGAFCWENRRLGGSGGFTRSSELREWAELFSWESFLDSQMKSIIYGYLGEIAAYLDRCF